MNYFRIEFFLVFAVSLLTLYFSHSSFFSAFVSFFFSSAPFSFIPFSLSCSSIFSPFSFLLLHFLSFLYSLYSFILSTAPPFSWLALVLSPSALYFSPRPSSPSTASVSLSTGTPLISLRPRELLHTALIFAFGICRWKSIGGSRLVVLGWRFSLGFCSLESRPVI